MAEVKPMHSAVGAFEAQVFPMNKAVDLYIRGKQYEQQRQRAAEAQLDTMMANTFSEKGQGRAQDIEGLESEYSQLQQYYLENKNKILQGGTSSLEFQKKRSAFLYNVQYSKALKEKERAFLPAWKTVAGKTEMDAPQIDAMNIFNKSIYDTQRSQWKFNDGRDIDNMTPQDFTPSETFNKVNMDKVIATNVKDYKVSTDVIRGDKKERIEVNMQDPTKILGGTVSYLTQYPKADRFYQSQFESMSPEDIDMASQEMHSYASMFTGNKSNPIAWDKDGDGKISNHVEYAVYDQIKRNLPEELGSKIDFSPLNSRLAVARENRAAQQFAFQKEKWYTNLFEKQQNKPIDEAIADTIVSGTGTPENWNAFATGLDKVYSRDQESTGNVKGGQVIFLKPEDIKTKMQDPQWRRANFNAATGFNPEQAKDGALMFVSQTKAMVTDAQGNLVPHTSSNANDITPLLKAGIPASQIFTKKNADGTYEFYRKQVKFVSVDKGRSPQDVRFDVKAAYSLLSESATSPVIQEIDKQLTKRNTGFVASPTNDTPVGGGGTNKTSSKGSSTGGSKTSKTKN